MHFRFQNIITIVVVLGGLMFIGAACTREQTVATPQITLRYWHVFDSDEGLRALADAFRLEHPNVNIEFRRFTPQEYDAQLLNALAAGRGPDLFSIHDRAIGKYEDKIFPLPATLRLPEFRTEGTISKKTVAVMKEYPTLTPRRVRDLFADVVADTVVRPVGSDTDGVLVGLPLALDTMVLYTNRTLLNLAGIPEPPAEWVALGNMVTRLARVNERFEVLQAAVALGGATNIDRASDILALLMMQNGAEMIQRDGTPVFDRTPALLAGRSSPPAIDALYFYSDFAIPTKERYTWNEQLPEALTAFTGEQAAMFLGYAYHLPLIRARAPRMNLTWTPVPQIEGNPMVNYANYWVTSVSKQTAYPNEAWAFILFATTREDHAYAYAETARRPVALRSLIDRQRNDDEEMRVFVDAVLTAKSWYRGKDPEQMETIFRDMILDVVEGRARSADEAVRRAVQRVRQTY